jgi:hypothetical protein
VRGLSAEERAELLRAGQPEQSDAMTVEALKQRGLVGPWYCYGCGLAEPCSTVGCCSTWSVAHPTASGLLALRLDAAARALGVPA